MQTGGSSDFLLVSLFLRELFLLRKVRKFCKASQKINLKTRSQYLFA